MDDKISWQKRLAHDNDCIEVSVFWTIERQTGMTSNSAKWMHYLTSRILDLSPSSAAMLCNVTVAEKRPEFLSHGLFLRFAVSFIDQRSFSHKLALTGISMFGLTRELHLLSHSTSTSNFFWFMAAMPLSWYHILIIKSYFASDVILAASLKFSCRMRCW